MQHFLPAYSLRPDQFVCCELLCRLLFALPAHLITALPQLQLTPVPNRMRHHLDVCMCAIKGCRNNVPPTLALLV